MWKIKKVTEIYGHDIRSHSGVNGAVVSTIFMVISCQYMSNTLQITVVSAADKQMKQIMINRCTGSAYYCGMDITHILTVLF